ncbi:MAG: hypothetical protein IAE91_15385 [Ignavibacteriaceae bacterium]|nr:hypothetical protein [Ignavibacteriaceae bacterium]
MNNKVLVIGGIILIAAAMRLVPHYPNFTPIAAIALFGGAYLSDKRLAFLLPLVALFISDLVLGFHNTMIPVYACFALTVFIGMNLRNRVKPLTVAAGALGSSVVFFLVTNFALFYPGYYPANISGILMSYTAAIPFFHYSLAGDLFYSAVIFGAFELAKFKLPALAEVK